MVDQKHSTNGVAAVVLCGGRSSRMGYSKADLPFGDRSLLRRVIDRIAEAGIETIILAAAEGQQLPADVPATVHVVRDSAPERGPLEALGGGLHAAAPFSENVFVTACDTPFLQPQLVRHLIDRQGDYEIVATSEDRFVHPLIAVYRTRLASRIDSLIANNQMRPLTLIKQSHSLCIDVEELRALDPELLSFQTMNHPEDYWAAIEREGLTAPDEVRKALSSIEHE